MQIAGKAGIIEALTTSAATSVSDAPADTIVIVCHPHPQYGGNMHDGVVAAISDAFLCQGVDTCRFNFRGVGQSAGTFDQGRGEVDDLLTVIEWASDGYQCIYLAGYSFGAIMVIKALAHLEALAQQTTPAHLSQLTQGEQEPQKSDRQLIKASVLVAPPVQMLETISYQPDNCLVIVGDEDQIVTQESVKAYFTEALVKIVPDADHFFQAEASVIVDLIGSNLPLFSESTTNGA